MPDPADGSLRGIPPLTPRGDSFRARCGRYSERSEEPKRVRHGPEIHGNNGTPGATLPGRHLPHPRVDAKATRQIKGGVDVGTFQLLEAHAVFVIKRAQPYLARWNS